MNGWSENLSEVALVLGLLNVVELLADAQPDLARERLDVEPGHRSLREPQHQAQVLHVGPDGRGHARVLHLDRHGAAVVSVAL